MMKLVDYHPKEPWKGPGPTCQKVMSSLVTVCPQDFSETEITHVVPFCIEDARMPEALLFNQQVPRALTPLNCVTVGVVTPSRPETPPAVGTPAVASRLSADAKKLLQGGLEELQQVGHYHHTQIYDDIH